MLRPFMVAVPVAARVALRVASPDRRPFDGGRSANGAALTASTAYLWPARLGVGRVSARDRATDFSTAAVHVARCQRIERMTGRRLAVRRRIGLLSTSAAFTGIGEAVSA
jgi:hypothetical protein